MTLNKKVGEYFRVNKVDGDIGIEIECEGRNLIPPDRGMLWTAHADGSLRSNPESIEYTLSRPIPYKSTGVILEQLDKHFTKYATTVNDSPRTGVHVHLNVQNMYTQELYNLLGMYFIVENLFVEYSGADRVGNLFCLRSCDAEMLPIGIIQNLQNKSGLINLTNDNYRYASANLAALAKFGSLEFRTMRTPVTEDGDVKFEIIQEWIDAIFSLKKAAYIYKDPIELYTAFLRTNNDDWLMNHFPRAFAQKLMSINDWQRHMDMGSEYTFQLAYAPKSWIDLEALRKKNGKVEEDIEITIPIEGEGIPRNLNQARFNIAINGVQLSNEERQAVLEWEERNEETASARTIQAIVQRHRDDLSFLRQEQAMAQVTMAPANPSNEPVILPTVPARWTDWASGQVFGGNPTITPAPAEARRTFEQEQSDFIARVQARQRTPRR